MEEGQSSRENAYDSSIWPSPETERQKHYEKVLSARQCEIVEAVAHSPDFPYMDFPILGHNINADEESSSIEDNVRNQTAPEDSRDSVNDTKKRSNEKESEVRRIFINNRSKDKKL